MTYIMLCRLEKSRVEKKNLKVAMATWQLVVPKMILGAEIMLARTQYLHD